MRIFHFLAFVVLCMPASLAAFEHEPTANQNKVFVATEVAVDEFLELQSKADAVVLDVRNKAFYENNHIKNSVSFSSFEITQQKANDLFSSKDVNILLYDNKSLMTKPFTAVETTPFVVSQLHEDGYKNIYYLQSGEKSGLQELKKLQFEGHGKGIAHE